MENDNEFSKEELVILLLERNIWSDELLGVNGVYRFVQSNLSKRERFIFERMVELNHLETSEAYTVIAKEMGIKRISLTNTYIGRIKEKIEQEMPLDPRRTYNKYISGAKNGKEYKIVKIKGKHKIVENRSKNNKKKKLDKDSNKL